jgi:ketosteroid isomerase-like protein
MLCEEPMSVLQIELGTGIDALRAVIRLPRVPDWATPEQRRQLLEEEAVLRDDLAAYSYAYDAGDVEAVVAYFADDVAITNPRGRYTGSDLIRKNYTFLFEQWPCTRHFWANVAVRFPSVDEAYRASYVYGVLTSATKNFVAVGTDLHHLRKIDGRWKIVERWITDDVSYAIAPFGGPLEDTSKAP